MIQTTVEERPEVYEADPQFIAGDFFKYLCPFCGEVHHFASEGEVECTCGHVWDVEIFTDPTVSFLLYADDGHYQADEYRG